MKRIAIAMVAALCFVAAWSIIAYQFRATGGTPSKGGHPGADVGSRGDASPAHFVEGIGVVAGPDRGEAFLAAQRAAGDDARARCRQRCGSCDATLRRFAGLCTPLAQSSTCTVKVTATCIEVPR